MFLSHPHVVSRPTHLAGSDNAKPSHNVISDATWNNCEEWMRRGEESAFKKSTIIFQPSNTLGTIGSMVTFWVKVYDRRLVYHCQGSPPGEQDDSVEIKAQYLRQK